MYDLTGFVLAAGQFRERSEAAPPCPAERHVIQEVCLVIPVCVVLLVLNQTNQDN